MKWIHHDEEALLRALAPWLGVLQNAEGYFNKVQEQHGEQMQCEPGCNQCCQAGLTLLPAEAQLLLLGLHQLPEAATRELQHRPESQSCPLLDGEGRCSVYQMRPLVCRTHGIPLLQDGAISCCPLNFTESIPPKVTLNAELLAAQSMAADAVVRGNREPGQRVALRELLLHGAEALSPLSLAVDARR